MIDIKDSCDILVCFAHLIISCFLLVVIFVVLMFCFKGCTHLALSLTLVYTSPYFQWLDQRSCHKLTHVLQRRCWIWMIWVCSKHGCSRQQNIEEAWAVWFKLLLPSCTIMASIGCPGPALCSWKVWAVLPFARIRGMYCKVKHCFSHHFVIIGIGTHCKQSNQES